LPPENRGPLSVSQKSYLLICAATLFSAGALAQSRPQFEVASLKPNTDPGSRVWLAPPVGDTFTATNVTPRMLISTAWGVANSGGPAWLNSDRYDLIAKTPDAHDTDLLNAMLRTLLEDRFKLQTHSETHEIPGYALTAAKTGLKLTNANPVGCATWGLKKVPGVEGCDGMSAGPGFVFDKRLSMTWFTGVISNMLGRPVVDQTGYTGSFEVHLEFAPLQGDGSTDSTKPSLFTALQELGLKLESQKVPVQMLIIDHAEKATEN
jgi:uncharacterized protein (TIGR03435 family)